MPKKVSIQVTKKNLREVRRGNMIVGIFGGINKDDDYFEFINSRQIVLAESTERGMAFRGGAIGGYNFRRVPNESDYLSGDLFFPRDGYFIGFSVYSNATLSAMSWGNKYAGMLAFPRRHVKRGVRDMFTFVSEISEAGIVRELNEEERKQLISLVSKDLRTGKHTKEAMRKGAALDAMFGM